MHQDEPLENKKGAKMRNANPISRLKTFTVLVGLTMVILIIVARLEGKKTGTYFGLSIIVFIASLTSIHSAFKFIDKRLSDVEEKISKNDK